MSKNQKLIIIFLIILIFAVIVGGGAWIDYSSPDFNLVFSPTTTPQPELSDEEMSLRRMTCYKNLQDGAEINYLICSECDAASDLWANTSIFTSIDDALDEAPKEAFIYLAAGTYSGNNFILDQGQHLCGGVNAVTGDFNPFANPVHFQGQGLGRFATISGELTVYIEGLAFDDYSADAYSSGQPGGIFLISGRLCARNLIFTGSYASRGSAIFIESYGYAEIFNCNYSDFSPKTPVIENLGRLEITSSYFDLDFESDETQPVPVIWLANGNNSQAFVANSEFNVSGGTHLFEAANPHHLTLSDNNIIFYSTYEPSSVIWVENTDPNRQEGGTRVSGNIIHFSSYRGVSFVNVGGEIIGNSFQGYELGDSSIAEDEQLPQYGIFLDTHHGVNLVDCEISRVQTGIFSARSPLSGVNYVFSNFSFTDVADHFDGAIQESN